MSGFWQLTVHGHFSAAHALRNYHGKCEKLHGHNFEVEISVEGSNLDQATGLLLDFGVLKNILGKVLGGLDHSNLGELAPFRDTNPSSENLAKYIWEKFQMELDACPDPQAKKVRLASVSVSEKNTQKATWFGTP